MMPRAVFYTTIQAGCLSAVSNVSAQVIKAYRTKQPFALNIVPLVQFVVFTLLSCAPNFFFQQRLEELFPGQTVDALGHAKLHIFNTAKKLVVDQTVGAGLNTVAFLIGMGYFKGKSARAIRSDLQRDMWPLMVNGWKLWPMVAIINFTLIPVDRRVLVGSIVGTFWGVYLSLFAAT